MSERAPKKLVSIPSHRVQPRLPSCVSLRRVAALHPLHLHCYCINSTCPSSAWLSQQEPTSPKSNSTVCIQLWCLRLSLPSAGYASHSCLSSGGGLRLLVTAHIVPFTSGPSSPPLCPYSAVHRKVIASRINFSSWVFQDA